MVGAIIFQLHHPPFAANVSSSAMSSSCSHVVCADHWLRRPPYVALSSSCCIVNFSNCCVNRITSSHLCKPFSTIVALTLSLFSCLFLYDDKGIAAQALFYFFFERERWQAGLEGLVCFQETTITILLMTWDKRYESESHSIFCLYYLLNYMIYFS